jgi:hypothetical protein
VNSNTRFLSRQYLTRCLPSALSSTTGLNTDNGDMLVRQQHTRVSTKPRGAINGVRSTFVGKRQSIILMEGTKEMHAWQLWTVVITKIQTSWQLAARPHRHHKKSYVLSSTLQYFKNTAWSPQNGYKNGVAIAKADNRCYRTKKRLVSYFRWEVTNVKTLLHGRGANGRHGSYFKTLLKCYGIFSWTNALGCTVCCNRISIM